MCERKFFAQQGFTKVLFQKNKCCAKSNVIDEVNYPKKEKSRWMEILQLLLTNPLNSQLDTNVVPAAIGKKSFSYSVPSLL